MIAEQAFDRIDIFEQRARVGGVWDYSPHKVIPPELSAPQTSPHSGLAKPDWDGSGTKQALGHRAQEEARFLSPLYDRLETNIPRTLMGFSDLHWPQDSQLFPKHETVTQYLEQYAEDVKHLIEFQTQVLDVRLNEAQGKPRWTVKTRRITHGHQDEVKEGVYDAVMVASGHFNVPFIPSITGLAEWSKAYPGAVSHSMYYQKPEQFTGKVRFVLAFSACPQTDRFPESHLCWQRRKWS